MGDAMPVRLGPRRLLMRGADRRDLDAGQVPPRGQMADDSPIGSDHTHSQRSLPIRHSFSPVRSHLARLALACLTTDGRSRQLYYVSFIFFESGLVMNRVRPTLLGALRDCTHLS